MISVAIACFTSGFASVFFEWTLETNGSLWARNFQLTFFALIFSIFGIVGKDSDKLRQGGLFQGFDWTTWLVVGLQAFGGIIVALVVKYADNILKNFATAISIITSTLFTVMLFDFELKLSFVIGSIFVLFAVLLYTINPAPLLIIVSDLSKKSVYFFTSLSSVPHES